MENNKKAYIVRRFVPRETTLASNEMHLAIPADSLPFENLETARKRAIEESHSHPCVVAEILENWRPVEQYKSGNRVG